MDNTIQILEEQIKALKELISIKDQAIQELKARPSYVPYYIQPQYTWHYGYPYFQYIGVHQGGSGSGGTQNVGSTLSDLRVDRNESGATGGLVQQGSSNILGWQK